MTDAEIALAILTKIMAAAPDGYVDIEVGVIYVSIDMDSDGPEERLLERLRAATSTVA